MRIVVVVGGGGREGGGGGAVILYTAHYKTKSHRHVALSANKISPFLNCPINRSWSAGLRMGLDLCAAAAISVDWRGGVTVPNSSVWTRVRAKLNICPLIVCWTDIGTKTLHNYFFMYLCAHVGKCHISCTDNKRAVRTPILDRGTITL